MLSATGVKPDPKNIEAVKSFRKPNTITELRSLIGAISYFRRFIPAFAKIVQPLYQLTKCESVGGWKDEHTEALEIIKEKLVNAPVLAPPRFGQPFEVETDASAKAIAAVLLQRNNNNELHPIVFASRTLNKHECRYPSVELEAMAVAFAAKEFAPYLEGSGTSVI